MVEQGQSRRVESVDGPRRRGVKESSFSRAMDRLDPYATIFHRLYQAKSHEMDNGLLLHRGFHSTLQFEEGAVTNGRIAVVTLEHQDFAPIDIVLGNVLHEQVLPFGCRQAVVATVPHDELDSHRSKYLGVSELLRGPSFFGLPEDFKDKTEYTADEYAIGLSFDQKGRVSELFFQGMLESAGKSVTYAEPIHYRFDLAGNRIKVIEPTLWGRQEREHAASSGILVPLRGAGRGDSLGIPIEDEVAMILKKLPFEIES